MTETPNQPFENARHAFITGQVAAVLHGTPGVEIRSITDAEGNWLPYLWVRDDDHRWSCWLHILPIPDPPGR